MPLNSPAKAHFLSELASTTGETFGVSTKRSSHRAEKCGNLTKCDLTCPKGLEINDSPFVTLTKSGSKRESQKVGRLRRDIAGTYPPLTRVTSLLRSARDSGAGSCTAETGPPQLQSPPQGQFTWKCWIFSQNHWDVVFCSAIHLGRLTFFLKQNKSR